MADNMELEMEEVLQQAEAAAQAPAEQVTETAAQSDAPVVTEQPKKKKKKASGKKKKKKKKKSNLGFIIGMILYAVIFLAAAYFGLNFLWDYMASYEASRPNNTVNAYMEQLTGEHIVDMCQDVIDQIDHNLQSEEECRQILLSELSGGVRHAKKTKECTDTRMVYVLRAGSTVVGEFVIEANEPDQFGFTTWEVTDESFDMSYMIGEKKTVTAPDACVVTVNGTQLDESYVIEDNIHYEDIEEYYEDYDLPCQVTYEAGPLLGDFEMVVTDTEGNVLTFDENTDWSVYYLNCTAEETEALDDFAELFLERYVDFTGSNKNTRHTTYNALIKHVLQGSDLATRLKDAIAGLQFGQSKGDEIVSIVTHLQIRLDEKYLVDLTYEVDTTGKEGVVRTTTNARLLIAQTDDGLKVESIIIY